MSFFSKGVLAWNFSCKNEFALYENERVGETHFDAEAKDISKMAYFVVTV